MFCSCSPSLIFLFRFRPTAMWNLCLLPVLCLCSLCWCWSSTSFLSKKFMKNIYAEYVQIPLVFSYVILAWRFSRVYDSGGSLLVCSPCVECRCGVIWDPPEPFPLETDYFLHLKEGINANIIITCVILRAACKSC